MLIVTSVASYLLYRLIFRPGRRGRSLSRDDLRRYYHEQRDLARKLSQEFDVSDEEIEARIEREVEPRNH
jgi:hypothetical protein